MTEKKYCYHCRSFHLPSEVTLVQTSSGQRWRCLKSLTLGKSSRAQRDAFGKSVSELNQANNLRQTGKPLPRPVLELFGYPPGRIESLA